VHWDNPEEWYGEGGGRGVQDGLVLVIVLFWVADCQLTWWK